MDFSNFTTRYNRYRFTPRTADEAFRSAEYATALEIHVQRVKWRQVIGEVLAWVGISVAAFGILFAIARGLA